MMSIEQRVAGDGSGAVDPLISVIVPVYNDAAGLRETVSTLLQQDYPPDRYEIIVVDNGSTDSTPGVMEEFAKRYPGRVRAEREPRRGSYAARNRGISCSRGEILCFIDADMSVPPDYLRRVRAELDRGVDYLGCRVEQYSVRPTRASEYDEVYGFPIHKYLRDRHFCPTCCLSIRRRVIEEVGGFDDRLESGGDVEFGQRIHAAGFTQGYADDIVLRHPARDTFRALWSKSKRVARGNAQLYHYYPERFGDLPKRYAQLLYCAPRRPSRIIEDYAARGRSITFGSALIVSFCFLPLRWVRLASFLRESRRLRKLDRRHGAARAFRAAETQGEGD